MLFLIKPVYHVKVLIIIFLSGYCLFSVNGETYLFEDIEIKPQVTVSQIFDDNITSANANRKKDFITDLSIGLDMKYEGKTDIFGLVGTIRQQLFARESGFNNVSQSLNCNFQKEFSKYDRVDITNNFLHAEEPGSFQDSFGRTSGRYSYCRNRFEFEYVKDLSKPLALLLRYGSEFYNVSRDDLSDSFLHHAGIEIDFIQNWNSRFLLGYDFSIREFDPGNNVSTHDITLGYQRMLNKQLTLKTNVGISFIDAFGSEDLTEPDFSVSLKNEVDETTTFDISFQKDSNSTASTQDIFDSWRVAAGFVRQLARRLSLALSTFYGKGEYNTLNIKDTFTGAKARLNYDLSENSRVFIAYAFSETDSNSKTRCYDKNTTSFGFTFQF